MVVKVVIFVVHHVVCRIRPFSKKLLGKRLISNWTGKVEPQLGLRGRPGQVEDPLAIPPTSSARVPGCGTDPGVISSSTSYTWHGLEQVTHLRERPSPHR